MTLHTVMPMELVLQGIHDSAEPLHETIVQGVRMQVMPVSPGVGRIVRLLECHLDDYLRPELSPGTLIQYVKY